MEEEDQEPGLVFIVRVTSHDEQRVAMVITAGDHVRAYRLTGLRLHRHTDTCRK